MVVNQECVLRISALQIMIVEIDSNVLKDHVFLMAVRMILNVALVMFVVMVFVYLLSHRVGQIGHA